MRIIEVNAITFALAMIFLVATIWLDKTSSTEPITIITAVFSIISFLFFMITLIMMLPTEVRL